jgi:hypothetical protein
MAELWKELHLRALTTMTEDKAYIVSFARRIPRYTTGCKCKEFWNLWVRQNPPTYGDDYFAWTVRAHNEVNKKLGKKEYTVEEARTIYTDN